MKRILVFLLAATMILGMLAICSSANDLNEPMEYRDEAGEIIGEPQGGKVPKIVGVDVVVDGKKEAFYNEGLKVNISRLAGNLDVSVSGTAYIVYDDSNLYAFVECNDDDFFDISQYITICPDCGKQRGQSSGCTHMAEGEHDPCNLWDDDCIEFMVDWSNDGSVPSQYRISRSGYMSRDWDTFNTGFSGKGYNAGATWGAEFSIPLDSSAAGTELGISIMIHSMNSLDPYNETYAMDNNYNAAGGPWDADYHDYIILDAPMANIDPDVDNPPVSDSTENNGGNTEPTTPGESTPVGGEGNNNKPTTPGATNVTPGGNGKPNPNTADPIVYIILAAVVSLGAAVVVKKTCFNK